MSVIIYGASDDLIEVVGDEIREEFTASDRTNYIALSNGVLLSVKYDDDGYWRINRISGIGDGLSIYEARGDGVPADDDGCPGYSDKVRIHGKISWVTHAVGPESVAKRSPAPKAVEA